MGIFTFLFDINPRVRNCLDKIFSNRLIVGVIISAIIAAIGSILPTLPYKLAFFAFLLVFAVIFFIFLFARDFIIQFVMNNNQEIIAKELTLLHFRRLILIDDTSKESGCEIIEYREVKNNMSRVYHQYLIQNSNDVCQHKFEDFHFKKNGQSCHLTESEAPFTPSTEKDITTPGVPVWHTFQLLFPVHIPPQESSSFELRFKSKGFHNALNNNVIINGKTDPDYIEIPSNTLAEKMEVVIKLTGERNRNVERIAYPQVLRQTGEPFETEIIDVSGQRMWISEDQLNKDRCYPKFYHNDTEMRWVIYHPKIGYRYRMYFTVLKRETYGEENKCSV